MTFNGSNNLNLLKNSNQDIPVYKDFDELDSVLGVLIGMTLDELRTYETAQGYKSVYNENYEIYELIDLDNMTDDDERLIYEFADQHPDNVWVFSNENRELEFAPRLVDNDYSLVVRNNRMFQVGDYVYKVFEEGLAYCLASKINNLSALSGFSLDGISVSSDIELIRYIDVFSDGRSSCSFPDVRYAESNNPRERLKLKTKIKTGTQVTNGITEYRANAFQRARNYRRIGWIWYHAKRTITGQLKFEVEYSFYPIVFPGVFISNELETVGYSSFDYYTSTAVYSRTTGGWRGLSFSELQSLFFKSIDSSVKNPATQNVVYICD